LDKTAAFGGEIIHLDATLIAEEPKLKPHYEKLKASLAALFHLPESRVSLKAKSNEGLDAIGRGEAIACHAVATVLAR
jgi:2-C-methyl-D-erythritol 2,4-cyclodiphosphate synthase